MYSKIFYIRITPHTLICFISQINIMYEYTETKSKYTGKIRTYTTWEQMYIILLN